MSHNLFDLLRKKNITPNQYYLLWTRDNKISPVLLEEEESLKEATVLRGIGLLDGKNQITALGKQILTDFEPLFKKMKPKTPGDILGPDFIKHIQTYRNKFPVGKKSTYEEVLNKFSNAFLSNPSWTWEKVHQATDLYFSQDIEETYRMKAGNFIKVDRGNSPVYTLKEYYERIEEGENPGTSNGYEMVKIL